MKKASIVVTFVVAVLAVMAIVLFGPSRPLPQLSGPVIAHFETQDGQQTSVTLTEEESARILEMLNGQTSEFLGFGVIPSCGFSRDTALEIDGRRYNLALDTCPRLQHPLLFRFISISDDEQQIIADILLRYGAKYPNV